MNESFTLKKYGRILMATTLILVIITEVLYLLWLKPYIFPGLVLPIIVLWLTTLAGHVRLRVALKKSPQSFVRTFMVVTTLKLFIYLAYMLAYCYFFRENAVAFLLTFVSAYFVFGIIDVITTLIFLKNKNPKDNQQHKEVYS